MPKNDPSYDLALVLADSLRFTNRLFNTVDALAERRAHNYLLDRSELTASQRQVVEAHLSGGVRGPMTLVAPDLAELYDDELGTARNILIQTPALDSGDVDPVEMMLRIWWWLDEKAGGIESDLDFEDEQQIPDRLVRNVEIVLGETSGDVSDAGKSLRRLFAPDVRDELEEFLRAKAPIISSRLLSGAPKPLSIDFVLCRLRDFVKTIADSASFIELRDSLRMHSSPPVRPSTADEATAAIGSPWATHKQLAAVTDLSENNVRRRFRDAREKRDLLAYNIRELPEAGPKHPKFEFRVAAFWEFLIKPVRTKSSSVRTNQKTR